MKKINVIWFRRDLRLHDNTALKEALSGRNKVLLLFMFDDNIIYDLPQDDARVTFIYENLKAIDQQLRKYGSSLLVKRGSPEFVWEELTDEFNIEEVFVNRDYEPYGIERDKNIIDFLKQKGILFSSCKDQVLFEPEEILKEDGTPYTVYTPYKSKWLEKHFRDPEIELAETTNSNYMQISSEFPELEDLDLIPSAMKVKEFDLSHIDKYAASRDFPEADLTTYLGPHLRFGTVSIREVISQLNPDFEIFLSELIWREFFMQIMHHFPRVVEENFKTKYNGIRWRYCLNNYERWCNGETGYPLVDAGMRQLNETGYMHNRVRMIAASFLCKHLLIDWRWGEDYFAGQLLDFELSSNNGNWQWVAGTGCDAAPYFRVFNPVTQQQKFDKDFAYIKKWVPQYNTSRYPKPIIDLKAGRERAISAYKEGIARTLSL